MTILEVNKLLLKSSQGEHIGSESNDVSRFPIKGGPCKMCMVEQGNRNNGKDGILE